MADNDDDEMDFMTGGDDDGDDDNWSRALVVPRRCINSIELELLEAMHLEQTIALGGIDPVPFQEGDDDAELERVAAHSQLLSRLRAPAAEKWGPLVEIARELGPDCTKQMYETRCKQMGVEPWPTN